MFLHGCFYIFSPHTKNHNKKTLCMWTQTKISKSKPRSLCFWILECSVKPSKSFCIEFELCKFPSLTGWIYPMSQVWLQCSKMHILVEGRATHISGHEKALLILILWRIRPIRDLLLLVLVYILWASAWMLSFTALEQTSISLFLSPFPLQSQNPKIHSHSIIGCLTLHNFYSPMARWWW